MDSEKIKTQCIYCKHYDWIRNKCLLAVCEFEKNDETEDDKNG